MKNPFAHLPFFITFGRRVTTLIGSDVSLPFGLSWHCGQLRHCLVPIEIGHRLDNHNEVIFTTINLHFEDSDFTLLHGDFRPESLLRMAMTILADQFGIIGDVKNLHITLGRLTKIFHWNTFHINELITFSKSFR